MSADDALLFIDANKYLDLYRTDSGKKLLAPLVEQLPYIFVTQQVVNEVQRNKIAVAVEFLRHKFRELKLQTFNVPDHLSGTSPGKGKDILEQMRVIGDKIKTANADVDALASGILEQISCSQDEVSTALARIFAKALPYSPEELHRAKTRRELGNPPGKPNNVLGDQLTWEQILTHFRGKKRLWIISRDGDYGTVHVAKGFLNCFLYDELRTVAPDAEVYLFEDTVAGIAHFVETTGVKAENQLTPEEKTQVEQEEKALPHLTQTTDELTPLRDQFAKFKLFNEARQLAAQVSSFNALEEAQRLAAQVPSFQLSEEARRIAAQVLSLSEEAHRLAERVGMSRVSEDAHRSLQQHLTDRSAPDGMRETTPDLASEQHPSTPTSPSDKDDSRQNDSNEDGE